MQVYKFRVDDVEIAEIEKTAATADFLCKIGNINIIIDRYGVKCISVEEVQASDYLQQLVADKTLELATYYPKKLDNIE